MTRRQALISAAIPPFAVSCLSAALPNAVREFAFYLARFQYLLLTTDNAGYRLCLVHDDKPGEIMRTSFSGFTLASQSPTTLKFDSRYDYPYSDEKAHFITLELLHQEDPGPHNNRSINNGDWLMTLTGHGYRFDVLRKHLLDCRVSELWTPKDSLVFRGSIATDQFGDGADYLHR